MVGVRVPFVRFLILLSPFPNAVVSAAPTPEAPSAKPARTATARPIASTPLACVLPSMSERTSGGSDAQ